MYLLIIFILGYRAGLYHNNGNKLTGESGFIIVSKEDYENLSKFRWYQYDNE